MNNIINSISKYPFSSLGENFLVNLTPQHVRIQKIVLLTFASLVACLGFIYYYLKAKNFNKDDGVLIKQIKIQPPTNVKNEEINDGVNNHKPTDQKSEKEEKTKKLAKSNQSHEEINQKKSIDKAEIPSVKEKNVPTKKESPFVSEENNGKPAQEQSLNLAKNPDVGEEKEIIEEKPPFIPSRTELKVDVKDDGVLIKQIKIQPPTKVKNEEIKDGVNNHKPTDQKSEKEKKTKKLAKSNQSHEEINQKKSIDKAEIPSVKEENVPTQKQSPFVPEGNNGKPAQEQSLNLAKNPDVGEEKEIKEEKPPFIPSRTELKVDVVVPKSTCLALTQPEVEKLEVAAIKIQSVWRGHSARVKVEKAKKHILSYALFEKAKPYVDIPSNLEGVPRAPRGKTRVYLPKELPIVLKQSGSPENQKRFDQMKQGREIFAQSGYENLVIPKARVYRNFIIESRLPITFGTKEQIGLYIDNRERFTVAVKEFTGFLYQSTFDGITTVYKDPYGTLSKAPLCCYDNIALYLEENQGKIGLIDLEEFKPGCSKKEKKWSFFKCRDAVNLFPYHLDEILGVAKNFDPDIQKYRQDLELERNESLKLFKLAYEDHLDFIKEKNITLENPLKMVEINPVRRDIISEAIVLVIRKEHDCHTKCLGEKPDEIVALFEKSFPKILDLTTAFLSEILKKKIKSTVSSYSQLLSLRTLFFVRYNHMVYRDLQKKVESELQMMRTEEEWEKEDIAYLIIESIFEELAKGREIAYYNPSFGYGGYAKHCIFC